MRGGRGLRRQPDGRTGKRDFAADDMGIMAAVPIEGCAPIDGQHRKAVLHVMFTARSSTCRLPGARPPEGRHQEPGSSSPYQDSMIRCAIDTGGGSSSAPEIMLARMSSREYQPASAISSSSTRIS